jgi:molecular chaperone HscC
MFEGIMEVRATAGDNFLGGEDFVDIIVDRFIAEVGAAVGVTPRSHAHASHANLRRQAEVAKRALSERDDHAIELVHDGVATRWTITRDDFEAASEPLVRRLRAPIERAIRDANLHPDQITDLVLVGGATRMPMVRRLAARLFQRLPMAQINPDEVVARGAAVQAGLKMRDKALDDVVMTDVAPYSLGVAIADRRADSTVLPGLFLPIIERNTVIPASRSKRLRTGSDGQRVATIRVFQGEARMANDNIEIGQLSFPLPPGPAGKETYEVRFTYDVSGLLEIEAVVDSTGQKFQTVIEGNPGILTQSQIAARLAELRTLKIDPREQTENRAIIARAERLYEERLGEERAAIGKAIDDFRVLLARQNTEEIEQYRTRFSEWLDNMDTSFFT